MRIIDADALIDTLGVSDEDINFREVLDSAPSIDIVRCCECKYWNEGKCWNLKGLNKTDGIVNANDYCSYGESDSEKPNNSERSV